MGFGEVIKGRGDLHFEVGPVNGSGILNMEGAVGFNSKAKRAPHLNSMAMLHCPS